MICRLSVSLLCAFLLVSSGLQAAETEKISLIRQLLERSRTAENAAKQLFSSVLNQRLKQLPKNEQNQRIIVQALINRESKPLMEKYLREVLLDTIEIYDQHLTLDEVKELVDISRRPVMSKMDLVYPKAIEEIVQRAKPRAEQMSQALTEKVHQILKNQPVGKQPVIGKKGNGAI